MPTRTVQYLIQTDPEAAGGPITAASGTYSFDLGRVAASGMKELLQTCQTGAPFAPLIRALLTTRNSGPLVWRQNGPGVGGEMKNAWSGIFGRFFARAFLERQGYSRFYPIPRNPSWVTGSLLVQRSAVGDLADWICAKSVTDANQGNVVIAEAKGRHREGTLTLLKLPRPLEKALTQIRNTLIWHRLPNQPKHQLRGIKGVAILTRWTNEEKHSGRAILRVVDPETPGRPIRLDEQHHISDELGRLQISDLLRGMEFDDLGFLAEPKERPWNLQEALDVIEYARDFAGSRQDHESRSIAALLRQQQRSLARFIPPTSKKLIDRLRQEAGIPQPVSSVLVNGLEKESFLGSVYGLAGRVNLPLPQLIGSMHRLPEEVVRQFIFIGLRAEAVEHAVAGMAVSDWQIAIDVQQRARQVGVFPSADNVIVAPANLLGNAGLRSFVTLAQ